MVVIPFMASPLAYIDMNSKGGTVWFSLHPAYNATMDDQAKRLLHSMTKQAKADRPYPWPALYLLAMHAHRHCNDISGSMLSEWLIAAGFAEEHAERFGSEFDRYRELLTMYDRSQPFRGHRPAIR
jgi:hypothetical protein